MSFYLIKRGPKPGYHEAPYHPVIICKKKKVAKAELGATDDHDWLWYGFDDRLYAGMLLLRWNGFDVDYGHVTRAIEMPDGTIAGVFHDRNQEPWTLLSGAVWWDENRIPERLKEAGVVYPADGFSQRRILQRLWDEYRKDLGKPDFWPD